MKQALSAVGADNTAASRGITRNPAWRPLMMKPLDDQEAMDKEAAIVLLQQRIHACRLCQEHGYIREAHPLTSGRGGARVRAIGPPPGYPPLPIDRPCRPPPPP